MADLIDTLWEITRDNGDVYHEVLEVTFLERGYFQYTIIKSKDNQGSTYGGGNSDETWKLENKSITISFNDGYMVQSGEINSNFYSMEGKFENQEGLKGEWSGKCLTKSKLKSTELTDKLEADKLIPAGFGRFADPETGEIVAKLQDGKLVPVS